MATFQIHKDYTSQQVMVEMLSALEHNPAITQRNLAGQLGIALGLINRYLKRSLTKGWIRASQLSCRKINYFLTPEGFTEKSRMVSCYLARSLSFFRDAKVQCEALLNECQAAACYNIALIGAGDLADIAQLVAQGMGLNLHLSYITDELLKFDGILITDIISPQQTYEALKLKVPSKRLLLLPLLHISISQTFGEN